VKSVLRLLCRWLYLPLAVLCGFYLSLSRVQHSNWYKERLYHQLLGGTEHERLKAAGALASVGGQEQLLLALKSDTPAVRELARRALEYVWFTDAGNKAHRVIEDAFDAAEKEDFETALGLLDRLVRDHPKFAEGWNRRASVYWKMGKFDKSIADCERALALNPNHYGAWQGIGVCRVELGDIAEACRCLRAALRITPYDEPTQRCLQKCEELLRAVPRRARATKGGDLI
jgi:tetratricopeptide (TPR) repeat protein